MLEWDFFVQSPFLNNKGIALKIVCPLAMVR
jgi:hypothetical protein